MATWPSWRVYVAVISVPHIIHIRGDDRPIMGFWAMRMPLTRGGQQLVRTHQPQDPARRRAETAMAQPGPHLAIAFAREGRRLQDTTDSSHQVIIRTGPPGPSPGARRRGFAPLPVDRGARYAPHPTDTRQAIGLRGGGRDGLAHRLDLLGRKGRSVSSRPIFSCNSSISMVDSPSFWRKRASS